MGDAAVVAFDQIVLKGQNAQKTVASLLQSMATSTLQAATRNFGSSMVSLLGGLVTSWATGGASTGTDASFNGAADAAQYGAVSSVKLNAQGGLIHMAASGRLLDSPTYLAGRDGSTTLAGEAGSEAILPLRRDANGNLGVVAGGGGGGSVGKVEVNLHGVTTQSGGQLSAEHARVIGEQIQGAVRQAVQQEMLDQSRIGGMANPVFG